VFCFSKKIEGGHLLTPSPFVQLTIYDAAAAAAAPPAAV